MRAFGIVALLVGCSARKVGPPIEPGRNVGATHPNQHVDAGPPAARLVATVGEKAIGPYLAMDASGGLVAYFATEGQQRALVTVPIDATGIPSGDARVAANVPVDSGTLVVKSLGKAFGLAWTALTDKGEAVYVQGVDGKGFPIGTPSEIARTTDDIVWIAIANNIVFWAEETSKGDADVLAVALDASGKARGVPSHIARGVNGWQALSAKTGAVLAVLRGKEQELAWVRLDGDGHASGAPVVVVPRASKDMDVVRVDDAYIAAWTDRSSGEPGVFATVIEADGKAHDPHVLTLGRGAGTLTQIAGRSDGAMIAWEESPPRKGARRVHLDVMEPRKGALVKGATIPVQTGAQPEITASATGFAFLGWTRLCAASADADACNAAPFVPSALALDAKGAITNADALPVAENTQPSFAWNLECTANGCETLEATNDGRTRVFIAPVLRQKSALAVAQRAPPSADAPEVVSIDTLASGAAIVEAATAKIGNDWAIASLASNEDNATATLSIRTTGQPNVLAKKALPIGGAAIAGTDDGAAIAWIARDNGDPQVHVTRVDKSGKKTADAQITTAKGDASDVAIGAVDGGWIVAWVDARDGNGEVYAARLDKNLKPIGPEQRVTNAVGDATDLSMLVVGDRAWLAFADPRESPKDGFADIYVASLDVTSAKQATKEVRVLPTAAHSRSPTLAKLDAGLAVAWIEDAPAGADARTASSYGAWIATLDAQGNRKGEAQRMKAADDGFATAVWLDPRATDRPRGVLVRSTDTLQLDAFDGSSAWTLLVLDGPPTLDVPLAFAGDSLIFGDDGPGEGDRRLRRLTLRWKR